MVIGWGQRRAPGLVNWEFMPVFTITGALGLNVAVIGGE
jgi:hypothetical protein